MSPRKWGRIAVVREKVGPFLWVCEATFRAKPSDLRVFWNVLEELSRKPRTTANRAHFGGVLQQNPAQAKIAPSQEGRLARGRARSQAHSARGRLSSWTPSQGDARSQAAQPENTPAPERAHTGTPAFRRAQPEGRPPTGRLPLIKPPAQLLIPQG